MELTRRERALLEEAKRTQGGDPVSPYLALITFMACPILICLAFLVGALFRDPIDLSGVLWLTCMTGWFVMWAWGDLRRRQTACSLVRKLIGGKERKPDAPGDQG